jgi:hypothetical protein
MNNVVVKPLKGGSLASTDVIDIDGKLVVQKKIILNSNREYGYYRWQSQLRMLLSYSNRWPDLFPKILNYGVDKGYAFYTIPYYESWLNAYEYIQQEEISYGQLKELSDNIISEMSRLHDSAHGIQEQAWELYYAEDVEYAMQSIPQEILMKDTVVLNDKAYRSLTKTKDEFYEIGKDLMRNIEHSEVHGNLTLENILVSPKLKIMFIDPYFEVGVSSPFGDYAQLFQSTNSQYEVIMAQISKNNFTLSDDLRASLHLPLNPKLKFVNDIFIDFVVSCDDKAYFKTRWLEITQFIRMLPFKFSNNQKAGTVIYIYTCKLLETFLVEYRKKNDV